MVFSLILLGSERRNKHLSVCSGSSTQLVMPEDTSKANLAFSFVTWTTFMCSSSQCKAGVGWRWGFCRTTEISLRRTSHPVEKTHYGWLYLQSQSYCHFSKLVNTGEHLNEGRLINDIYYIYSSALSPHFLILIQSLAAVPPNWSSISQSFVP